MKKIIIHFDGACEPINPGGNMGIGCIAHDELGNPLFERADFIPAHHSNSNNVAEYRALLTALLWLKENDLHRSSEHEILIFGDSMLVIQQMNREWRIKGGRYSSYAREAMKLLSDFTSEISFSWISRNDNYLADALSKAKMIENEVEFKIQSVKR